MMYLLKKNLRIHTPNARHIPLWKFKSDFYGQQHFLTSQALFNVLHMEQAQGGSVVWFSPHRMTVLDEWTRVRKKEWASSWIWICICVCDRENWWSWLSKQYWHILRKPILNMFTFRALYHSYYPYHAVFVRETM